MADKKILIVEDNAIAQACLVEMVKSLGLEADVVSSGKEALLKYKQTHSLILMDVDLPDLSGIEVTQILRNFEKAHGFQAVPIVAITSHFGEEDYVEKCLLAGMNGVSKKPTLEILKNLLVEHTEYELEHA